MRMEITAVERPSERQVHLAAALAHRQYSGRAAEEAYNSMVAWAATATPEQVRRRINLLQRTRRSHPSPYRSGRSTTLRCSR
jgi:predicted anti-sigma-YlaC factor YlaD